MTIDPNPNKNNGETSEEATLKVPSKDPKKKKDEKKDEDLSDEDLALKQQLELYVERVQDTEPGVQKLALESMRQEIRTSTSSMTSVPKPLKFLRPHYETLKTFYEKMGDSELKKYLADILSVLALTMSAEGELESLKYRLLGSEGDIGSWGHEYVRNLAGEISQEYAKRQIEEAQIEDLMELVQQIVAFHMKHNAEPEAVDLLMEVEDLDLLVEHVDATNYKRTCHYLTSSASYLPGPDDLLVLDIAYVIYLKFEEYPLALRIALVLDNLQYVKQMFTSCNDIQRKKQFCYILARHGVDFVLDEDMVADDDDREACQDIINNMKLSEGYLNLARDIEVMEPKSPEDIYKVHLIDGRASAGASVDSARQNLAATFVNAFVNAGFGQDKLMTVASETSSGGSTGSWLFKNKEHGKASAAASLQRGRCKEEEFVKKVQKMFTEEEKLRIPIGQGLPWTTDEPEFLVKPPAKEITRPVDLKLHSDVRAVERAEFDHHVAEKLSLLEQYRLEKDRQLKLEEQEEVKRLRKELVPRAQPMPYFDRPFIPKGQ